MTIVGVVAPGAMGAEVGRCLAQAAVEVCWASAGRSDATRRRAAAAGLRDVGELADLSAEVDVLLSICPPHAALETAETVMAAGFTGIYVDANAVAPATARRIAHRVEPAARFVDGGLIGPPPREVGTTRLYLAGEHAPTVAQPFTGTDLEAVVLDGEVPAASALKMAYAAWTKGSSALLLAARAYAAAEGVEQDLVGEWGRSQPDLPERTEMLATRVSPKAWRWIAEMDEIAAAFDAVGLPPGFHRAAADIYSALEHRREVTGTTLPDALADLVARADRPT